MGVSVYDLVGRSAAVGKVAGRGLPDSESQHFLYRWACEEMRLLLLALWRRLLVAIISSRSAEGLN
jgi:hypothetical protein